MRTHQHQARKRPAPWAAAVVVALASGCGSLVNQLQASQMAGAILTQTPDVTLPGGGGTVAGATVFTLEFASVNLAAVNSSQPTSAATPTDGASVSLQYTDATNTPRSINVPGQGNGTYLVSSAGSGSASDSALTYVQNTVYTAVITYAGSTYQLQVTPPAPIGISFNTTAGTMDGTSTQPIITGYPAGTALTIGRVPSTDTSVAFYEMSTVVNRQPTLVTTNAPETVPSFLEFILPGGTTPFQAPTFDIGGSFFTSGSTFLITLTSVAQGGQVNDPSLGTLFAGSSFLAGAAAGGIVSTQ